MKKIRAVQADQGTQLARKTAENCGLLVHEERGIPLLPVIVDRSALPANSNAISQGELPAGACDSGHSVDFVGTGLESGTVHGTGVAEHVIDMAPGVELYCLRVSDQLDLENAADYIRTKGIQIANHSVAWVLASLDSGDLVLMMRVIQGQIPMP